jgi:hypothetical protein
MKDQETAVALMYQAKLGMQLAQAHLKSAESALDRDGSVEVAMANLISAGLAMASCLSKFNSAITSRAAAGSSNLMAAGINDHPQDCELTAS